jgi:hypothetical protein
MSPTPVSGTPRVPADFKWSPASTPRPPEYCGRASAIPNSGEKYATERSGLSVRVWNQRPTLQ